MAVDISGEETARFYAMGEQNRRTLEEAGENNEE